MNATPYNPADYPDGHGPRPPELIDDPLEVAHDEIVRTTDAAIAQVAHDYARLEHEPPRPLQRP